MSVKRIFVVMTFSVMAWKSLGLKWTTEALHTNCCEGQDKILMWNWSLEKNETVQNILWFFNLLTEIAYVSESGQFYVRDLYKSKVEQIGKMGILLKNVSSSDTGNYSLYLNLGPEPPENMQTIFLTVFESPTYQCKPSITNYSENIIFCSTKSCRGKQLSAEWRISEQYEFVSNESYLKINSAWNSKLISCCLHIKNMQCQNGNLLDFCASTIIFFAKDKHAPDFKYTENSMNLTPAVIVLATSTFLSILTVVICFSYRKKRCKLCAKRHMDRNIELEPMNELEAHPMMGGPRHFRVPSRSSEACMAAYISDAGSLPSEGRTSETSVIVLLSDAASRRSEGRTSEPSMTVHVPDAGLRISQGRTSEPCMTVLFPEAGLRISQGRTSEPSMTVHVPDAGLRISQGSSNSQRNENIATNSVL